MSINIEITIKKLMNNFEIAENKGRSLLQSFLNQVGATDQKPTTDKYDTVDYYFTYKDKKAVAEIKVRDIKYKDYSTHIIEHIKLKELVKAKEQNNCDCAYYINFFGDDIVYWYSTTSIINNASKGYLHTNHYTAKESEKVDKAIWNIPVLVAEIYIRKDGVWCKA